MWFFEEASTTKAKVPSKALIAQSLSYANRAGKCMSGIGVQVNFDGSSIAVFELLGKMSAMNEKKVSDTGVCQ